MIWSLPSCVTVAEMPSMASICVASDCERRVGVQAGQIDVDVGRLCLAGLLVVDLNLKAPLVGVNGRPAASSGIVLLVTALSLVTCESP